MQIYKITNLINSKIYIGKDTTSDSNYFGSGLLINRSFEKYGMENFIKEVIDETTDYDELSSKEIYWIEKYNSTDREIGYNISKGGDGGDVFSNHPNLDLIKEKISQGSHTKGKTYEEAFGDERAKEYKEKLKKNIYKNILSVESKLKNQEKWQQYNNNFKERCNFIKDEINNGHLDEYLYELRLIKKRVNHNFLKNAKGFYKFFGDDLKYIFGKFKIREDETFSKLEILTQNKDVDGIISYLDEIPNRFFKKRSDFYTYIGEEISSKIKIKLYESREVVDCEFKIPIIIDNIKYESITDASKNLNFERTLIGYRLKSSHFKNYLFQDNELNEKYKKFEEIDPHLSKKQPISIKSKEYQSITEASKDLKKTFEYISWRLNSSSYTDWYYIDKEVLLIDTGKQKMRKVHILGKEYASISQAVKETGINREIMKYRIKTEKYTEYFYV
jgi:hypothetical protein